MAETICNTSPLQYLFQVELLELLPSLYQEVTIPEAVVVEIAEGRRQAVALPDVESLPWLQVTQVNWIAIDSGSMLPPELPS